MKKYLLLLFVLMTAKGQAQKIESIFFDLYTDSLKKGVHNYINVVAKMSNSSYYPLMGTEVVFSSNAGHWQGNSLLLDSLYACDSIVVSVQLKSNHLLTAKKTIYLKKNTYEPPLKTEQELLEEWRKPRGKSNN